MRSKFYTWVLALALATTYSVAQAPQPSQDPMPQDPMQQDPAQQAPDPTTPSTIPDDQSQQQPQTDMGEQEAQVSEQELHRQLHERFAQDPAFRNVQISVEENGKVRLDGTVASKDDKKRAKEMAKEIQGVRKVSNKIDVDENMTAGADAGVPQSDQPDQTTTTPGVPGTPETQTTPEAQTTPDTQTYPDTQTPPDATTPQSDQPQTTPDTSGQAGTAASDSDLKSQIESAIKNEPTLSGANVIVNVTADSIELAGSVSNGQERQTAKRIAESFAGNRRVVDNLTVTGEGAREPDSTMPQSEQPENVPPDESTDPNVEETPDPNNPDAPPVPPGL